MVLTVVETKMLPLEVDLNRCIGHSGDWVGFIDKPNAHFYEIMKRWTFYYPLTPNFHASFDELKLMTVPGEGYVPNQPWCTIESDYHYENNIFLDLTP